LLNDEWVIDEIKEEMKGCWKLMNLWDTAKAALRGKFIAMSAYIKSTERAQINDLIL
jgi:hypothetical protein